MRQGVYAGMGTELKHVGFLRRGTIKVEGLRVRFRVGLRTMVHIRRVHVIH